LARNDRVHLVESPQHGEADALVTQLARASGQATTEKE